MRLQLVAVSLAIPMLLWGGDDGMYEKMFTGKTMRVDYYHTGTRGEETLSLDQVVVEGDWPGSRRNLVDTLNLGEYMMRVYDRETNALIYSRGFSSMFNEWQTTDEALAGVHRTFSETVRFPFPKRKIQLTISRRDKKMVFHEVFSAAIDANDPTQVNAEKRPQPYKVATVMKNGDPAEKVDIAILGDGYTKAEMEKFMKDAKHFNDVMFGTHPFSDRKKDFNVWAVEVESAESGIDVPDRNVWKNNALGTMYNTFGSARYILTTENKTLRDAAAAAPYDFLCILVNDTRYGGGGIFNLYATTYTREVVKGQEWQMDYVYVHEFGHSFAGLGDEYYNSSTAYNDFYSPGVEPWEPNVTALVDKKNLKWKEFQSPGVDLPTTWEKARYDSIEALRGKLDRLAPDYYEKREPLYRSGLSILAQSVAAGRVGAFEGAGYASKGLYRPSVDCRMFSLSLVGFDPVCSAAINRSIDFNCH
ncbi:MAG: IgA Peptidase superfamily [Bacteroidetes bacterium]|nr:IgA Peptidase superfamily [Bacteroidota bacterium]